MSSYLVFKHVDTIQLENIAENLFSPLYEDLVLIIGNTADRLAAEQAILLKYLAAKYFIS